ncbi:hypothetical protein ABW21_db0206339 [Orbilia brochopaga]|nr:hypothetical protein ABW21_db0206339 [Drechslerella brochopaga]
MAATNQSFAIDKYSYCDVPMLQHDAKPVWNHHSARDHIYLVLHHEGPLEQPSVPGFPYMHKLLVKIIWRAETLESINVSDIANQKSNYIEFPNIVCMIRSPSLALKYVNLRSHTLRRMQVRFCRQEDFQAVTKTLEQMGCPIQLHNAETVQPIQQNILSHQYPQPETATSLLTGHDGTVAHQMQYSRAGTPSLSHMGTSAGLSRNQYSLLNQRLNAGGAHAALGSYTTPHVPTSLADTHSVPYAQPQIQHLRQPMLSRTASASLLPQESFHSSPPTSQSYHRRQSSIDLTGSQAHHQYVPVAHPAEQPVAVASNHYDPNPATSKGPSFLNSGFHAHLRRGSSTTSSLLSRPETAASLTNSIPVSRGTHTSVGTLFGNSQTHDSFSKEIAPSQQQVATVHIQHSQQYEDPELTDLDDMPPPRQLPDFDKFKKVHGDKPLPSSSAKLNLMFKNKKPGSPVSSSLKRKEPTADANDSDRENAKKQKTAAAPKSKKPAAPKPTASKPVASMLATPNPTKPKPAPKATAPKTTAAKPPAPAKPKKPKAATANITTPKKPAPKTPIAAKPSPINLVTKSPANILQDGSASNLNKKAGAQSPSKQNSTVTSKLEALLDVDGDVIDENLLAQLIHSDEHLKMMQRLERVWTKMGFGVRVKTSGLFGGSPPKNIVDLTRSTTGVEKDKS